MKVHFKELYLKKIYSTNKKAKELARRGLSEIIIIANEQTKGKGRFNRKWLSAKGGIYLSILLKEENIEKTKYLTFIAAISVVRAIEKIAKIKTKIKWPNDVHINKKKLCGILTESILGNINYVVVGVGINVNQEKFPKEIRDIAISLKIYLKKEIDKEKILGQFLKEFILLYDKYMYKKYNEILNLFKKNCDTIGKNVKAVTLNKEVYGKAVDVDKDCNLILMLKNSEIKKIIEGDIFVLD